MKFLDEKVVLAYIAKIEEDSREVTVDGEVSYPYQAGALQQLLIDSLTSDIMRNVIIKQIEEKIYNER